MDFMENEKKVHLFIYTCSFTPVHLHLFIYTVSFFLKGWLLEKKGLNFWKVHRFIFSKRGLLEKKGLNFRKKHRGLFL